MQPSRAWAGWTTDEVFSESWLYLRTWCRFCNLTDTGDPTCRVLPGHSFPCTLRALIVHDLGPCAAILDWRFWYGTECLSVQVSVGCSADGGLLRSMPAKPDVGRGAALCWVCTVGRCGPASPRAVDGRHWAFVFPSAALHPSVRDFAGWAFGDQCAFYFGCCPTALPNLPVPALLAALSTCPASGFCGLGPPLPRTLGSLVPSAADQVADRQPSSLRVQVFEVPKCCIGGAGATTSCPFGVDNPCCVGSFLELPCLSWRGSHFFWMGLAWPLGCGSLAARWGLLSGPAHSFGSVALGQPTRVAAKHCCPARCYRRVGAILSYLVPGVRQTRSETTCVHWQEVLSQCFLCGLLLVHSVLGLERAP